MSTKIYVDNLAAVTTERDLQDLFSRYGNVTAVHIAVDRAHRKALGFGFVTMVTPEGAQSAIRALHGKKFGTHNLIVSEAWLHEERTNSFDGAGVPIVPAIVAGAPPEGES